MYSENNRFDYAKGYFLALPNGKIYINPETPIDIRKRLESDWEKYQKEKQAREEQGDFSSF